VSAAGTVTSRAGITGWLGGAGHGPAAAYRHCFIVLGEEDGEFALDMLAAASRAGYGLICLGHAAQCVELVAAILTDVFVNWHEHLD